jgi:DNA-directed RNA polymerase specialized sigma24 family protein
MAKKKGNAGSKKASAATKAKRSSAKAQKTRAAKDAVAVKAVLDAEAARQAEVDENKVPVEETSPPDEEAAENEAPEVDEPAPKKRHKPGRQKGDASPQAEVERQEHIKEAMEYRLLGYTYRQIAEQMEVAPSTAYKWVSAGLADITPETAEELRRVMFEQCHQIIQKLMPLVDDPRDVVDSILKVQQQQMKLAAMLQGNSVSINLGKGAGEGEEDIIVRIKADAPVLKPDEPVPANPVL